MDYRVRVLTSQLEKPTQQLRDYVRNEKERVTNHYRDMRIFQTQEFCERMEKKFKPLDKSRMTLREAFTALGDYVDASDPDMDLPNILHAFQSAEKARKNGEPDWLQLTLLLHDIGKIMFLWGSEEDGMSGKASGKQFALGGDTWVMGHPIPNNVVFSEFNVLNKDYNCQSKYEKGCGLAKLKFAFGHDEYGYYLLSDPRNGCKLPPIALQLVRLHSCYPLHRERAYDDLLAPGDDEILKAVVNFNQYDLYSKADKEEFKDLDRLWEYYLQLIDKYFEGGRDRRLYF